MRPSVFPRSQTVYRACEASTRRSLASAPQRSSPSFGVTCQVCSRKSARRISSTNTQRRWASQTSNATSQSSPDKAIKSHPVPQTHYEFFPKTLPNGPPPSGPFIIDVRELRREFLQLQAVAHPDRHPAHVKNRAEATSARINEAYKTLQNPLLRTQYLLSLRGIDVAEDETAKVEDPELLMEVLDTREEIENAREEEELEELKRINDERIEESEGVLDRAFREDDLELAKGEAVKLRYWVNIKESLDGWEKGKPIVLVH
ncbi:J-type accessory chaperone 1 [Hyphodiscus hymeniophilus]|uniref:J-type accessory chaperone 1 n=1 Tax=Hyphodiscus hymeniophilus TaxID=353542 RepID=A0A9P7AW46_9HELO|nr:J-type accessory chaperone 1 [Hyphodiscus hymeniophilus]